MLARAMEEVLCKACGVCPYCEVDAIWHPQYEIKGKEDSSKMVVRLFGSKIVEEIDDIDVSIIDEHLVKYCLRCSTLWYGEPDVEDLGGSYSSSEVEADPDDEDYDPSNDSSNLDEDAPFDPSEFQSDDSSGESEEEE